LTGHTDSVIAASFSNDGELAATGGMDGRVRVWRRVKGKNSDASNGGPAADLSGWQNWEFLTSLDTSDEVTVSRNSVQGGSSSHDPYLI
jgi:ribosome assembly protein SQT1